MIKIVELTKDNEEKYLDQIVELEQISLEAMKKEGREGQLFDTGREGISEYVHSNENSVIVATDENDKVEAATYVTQGQSPFTYNDITKYFKYGEKYKQYVKSQYLSDRDYKKDLRNIYIIKIKETKAPETYLELEEEIKLKVTTGIEGEGKEAKYVIKDVEMISGDNNGLVTKSNVENKIQLDVQNEQFDLSLRKSITEVIANEGKE